MKYIFPDTIYISLYGDVKIRKISLINSQLRGEIAAQLGLDDALSFVVVRVDCTMPEFEVGSSMRLSFADKVHTEMRFNLCTWLGEISSCSCLTVLPGPAWVLPNKICKD